MIQRNLEKKFGNNTTLEIYKKILIEVPNEVIINFTKEEFKEALLWLRPTKICSVLLEMTEFEIIDKIELVPTTSLTAICNIINIDIFLSIITHLSPLKLSSIVSYLDIERLEQLVVGLDYLGHLKIRAVLLAIPPSSLPIVLKVVSNTILKIFYSIIVLTLPKMELIIPVLNSKQIKLFVQLNEDDLSILEKSFYLFPSSKLKIAINSLGHVTTLKILGNITNLTSTEILYFRPSFLQMCVGITCKYIRLNMLKYIHIFPPNEQKIFFKLLPSQFIHLAIHNMSLASLIEIIPDLTREYIINLISILPESSLKIITPILSPKQLSAAFPQIEVESIFTVLKLLTSEQLWAIASVITAEQHKYIVDKTFSESNYTNIENFAFMIEEYDPYLIALGVTFNDIKKLILPNFGKLSRDQIWFCIPVMTPNDILYIIPLLHEDFYIVVISNICESQKFALNNELDRKLNILVKAKEKLINDFRNIEDKFNQVEKLFETTQVISNELMREKIVELQKTNIKLLADKNFLKTTLDSHNLLRYITDSTIYHSRFNLLCKYATKYFSRIYKLQLRLDAGDGTNGILNKFNKINKARNDVEVFSFNSLDSNEIWQHYNDVKETFDKMFEDTDINDIGVSWEDLIKLKLFTCKDYKELSITNTDHLKECIKLNL